MMNATDLLDAYRERGSNEAFAELVRRYTNLVYSVALLLRFFDGKRMRELGQALGVSEDAAKMRVNRALDRLRGELASRGLVCPAVMLGGLLASRSLEAAPAPLLERLAAVRYSVPQQGFGLGGCIDLILNTSKDKLAAGAVVLITVGVSIGVLLRSKPNEAEVVSQLERESTRENGTVERVMPMGQRVRKP
jgi:hypothetical protein